MFFKFVHLLPLLPIFFTTFSIGILYYSSFFSVNCFNSKILICYNDKNITFIKISLLKYENDNYIENSTDENKQKNIKSEK